MFGRYVLKHYIPMSLVISFLPEKMFELKVELGKKIRLYVSA